MFSFIGFRDVWIWIGYFSIKERLNWIPFSQIKINVKELSVRGEIFWSFRITNIWGFFFLSLLWSINSPVWFSHIILQQESPFADYFKCFFSHWRERKKKWMMDGTFERLKKIDIIKYLWIFKSLIFLCRLTYAF